MPFRFPFMPYNYNYSYRRLPVNHQPNTYYDFNNKQNQNKSSYINEPNDNETITNQIKYTSKEKEHSDDSECFFELFGIKLHFDDVLIICILIFLYNEEVRDYELFICLILLLIS